MTANDPDCNVYIANLPADFDKNQLYTLFRPYGNIIRHKFVAPDVPSQSGYGFVQFSNRAEAQNAIEQLQNYQFLSGETIYISLALHRRSSLSEEPTNLYVKNVPTSWSNEILYKIFSKCGTIRQCKIVKEGIAFVRYNDHNQALQAIDSLNGFKKIEIEFATRKTAATSYQTQQIPASKTNQHNLYVCNLPDFYTQKHLEELFKPFGKISAAKLNHKGIAFVRFVEAKDALSAINKLHGTIPNGFNQQIVVKLAHFDIGDCRNRMNKKDSPKQKAVQQNVSAVSVSQLNPIQNINILNMVNPTYPSMLHTPLNLNTVPLQIPNTINTINPMPLTSIPMIAPIGTAPIGTAPIATAPIGTAQYGYIIPSNLLSMPLNISQPQIPTTTMIDPAASISKSTQPQ